MNNNYDDFETRKLNLEKKGIIKSFYNKFLDWAYTHDETLQLLQIFVIACLVLMFLIEIL